MNFRKLLFAIPLATIPWMAQAQFPYATGHDFTFIDDELVVNFIASFSYGGGEACPPFSHLVSLGPDAVHLQVFYNTTGVWILLGCTRMDTVVIEDPTPQRCNLIISYHAIVDGGGGFDTVSFGTVDTLFICTTSIGTSSLGDGSMVWPNPFDDRIWIDLPDDHNAPMPIQVFDASGRLVHSDLVANSIGMVELNLTGLRPGTYFMHIGRPEAYEMIKLLRE
jgi:hypothetical protein